MNKFLIFIGLALTVSSCNEIKSKISGTSDLTSDNTIVSCDYTNLSNQNNYKFLVNYNSVESPDHVEYIVQVMDKSNKVLETITTNTKIDTSILEKIKVCDNVKSLSTQHNLSKNYEGLLYDGNFVIGDYNFDGKDDVAIYSRKDDNSGKYYYDYFLQNPDGKFERNSFLSDETDYFGKKYDVKGKTVVIQDNASIKKYSFENNQWVLKEDLKDPFPQASNKGYIAKKTQYGYQSFIPSNGLTIYDSENKPVGRLNNASGNIKATINGVINTSLKTSDLDFDALPYVQYKDKKGLYIQLDINGEYFVSSIELKNSGSVLINDIEKFIEGGEAFGTGKVVMNVRQSPSASANLITQIHPTQSYKFKFTGKTNGQWVEVSSISMIDDYYNEYHVSGKGWFKYLGDDGVPNFHEYYD